MKTYQCIHKYPPHIDNFEKKYGISNDSDITFDALRDLVIADGYASSYILLPALEGKNEEVFYTIWDYDRLQLLWAKENGLKSGNLDEIKKAQIEDFDPDVFYDMSAVYQNGNFIKKILPKSPNRKDVYWNAIIDKVPKTFLDYDGHISLHRPFVEYWESIGLAACELQPGIPQGWLKGRQSSSRDIDVLFYGQYAKNFFRKRAKTINELLSFSLETKYDVRVHLQYTTSILMFWLPQKFWSHITIPFMTHPPRAVRKHALPPLYGEFLHDAITKSKIVINGYTDNNNNYKSNMRLYEAIGHGAFLISEEGNYPEGLEPNVDFYTYTDAKSMIAQIERVLTDWPSHAKVALRTQDKIANIYSKERQWEDFQKFILSLT